MITISVCIGNTCHLKNSYSVISELQRLIDENNLNGKVEVKALFCLGSCAQTVPVRVDGGRIENISSRSLSEFFNKRILAKLP